MKEQMNNKRKINNENVKNNVKNVSKNKKKKSKGKKVFKTILLILLLVVIVYGIFFAIQYFRHKAIIDAGAEYDPLSATALGIDPEDLKNAGRINVLIMGESGIPPEYMDGVDYKLTDTIMLASYNPQTQQASILSIPRDTYVGTKDKDSATSNYLASYKINCRYRNGSEIEETVKCVENLTGMEIDNYILIDTTAIKDVVDAIGGVTFDVPIDMNYDDDSQDLYIHLEAGEQLLDGNKAEQLLRFRHNNDGSSYPSEYGDNDIGRMKTQREFIKTTGKQLFKIENVTKVLDLVNIVMNKVKTDIEIEKVLCYVPYLFKFDTNNIVTDTLPGTPELCNGIWIYTANKKETKQVVEDLFTDKVITEEENIDNTDNTNNTENIVGDPKQVQTQIKIELLNGTENTENLDKVKTLLKEEGYLVTKTATISNTSKTSIINRTKQDSNTIKNIKTVLGVGSSTNGSDNSNVDITIIIGEDYK